MDIQTVLELFAVGWAATEGTILYFVLRLRQNSKRIENEIIPGVVNQVVGETRTFLENVDWSKAGAEVYSRLEAGLEGMAGAAAKSADKAAGSEALKQLMAIDWGSPVANGIWSVFIASAGPTAYAKLGRIVRNLPVVGRYIDTTGSEWTTSEGALP